jgi:hypothetical protein
MTQSPHNLHSLCTASGRAMIEPICRMANVNDLTRCGRSAIRLNVSARCLCPSRDRRASRWFGSISAVIAPSRAHGRSSWGLVIAILIERSYRMTKSRYDRNVDRGAAQQRNYGQATKREDNKPETTAEAPPSPPRHGGAPKSPGGPARGGQDSLGRPKSRGDNG